MTASKLLSAPGAWLAALALALPVAAHAQQIPITHPASKDERVTVDFDRSAPPQDVSLWGQDRYVLGFDPNQARRYRHLHFTCRSDTDSATGRCPTTGNDNANVSNTRIPVRFTESRSHRQIDLAVVGHLRRAASHRSCAPWLATPQGLNSQFPGSCGANTVDGTGVTMTLPTQELLALHPGKWTAQLVLDLRNDIRSGPVLATYRFAFDITVTDRDSAAILFPDQPVTTPHVGLRLEHFSVGGKTMIQGSNGLDMCLYDGRGSHSSHLDLSIRDDGAPAPGRAPGMYSVWRHGGGGLPEERVDYEILVDHDGRRLRLANGAVQKVENVNSVPVRPVRPPGMNDFVYCVPTPLTLNTPPIDSTSKRPGYYRGVLTVEMTVPTSVP